MRRLLFLALTMCLLGPACDDDDDANGIMPPPPSAVGLRLSPSTVTAGAGEVTVRLPSDVGVRVSGRSEGIGEWDFDGFRQDGEYLVNDAYGSTATSIELDVQRGIGKVTLELVDGSA